MIKRIKKNALTVNTVLFISAMIVYATSAIFNNGYYYYDEHYQLIEFAELKAGNNAPSDLSWEYNAQIRSATQPVIAFYFMSVFRWLGLTDHYKLMIALRMITALLAVCSITYFIQRTQHLLHSSLWVSYRLTAYFLWFLPFVNVRFSSESYSGLALILSVAVLFSRNKNRYMLFGLLCGLNFIFRFQSAFMSFGIIVWLIVVHKIALKDLFKIVTALATMIFAGFLIDFWFYNSATITFVNYYVANIVDGAASRYGVSPWYFYFTESSQDATLPIGIVIWASILMCCLFRGKSLICWIIVPFLLVHALTPHKELRFLFPLANIVPLFILSAYDCLQHLLGPCKHLKWPKMSAVFLLSVLNSGALLVTVFSPANNDGMMNITETIHETYRGKDVILWIVGNENPYHPIPPNQKFYLDKNVRTLPLELLSAARFNRKYTNLILIQERYVDLYSELFESYRLKDVTRSIPAWISYLKGLDGRRDDPLLLYELEL
ncbi:hypothetical protein [Mucilaginibacter sp. dw_454]|uniref:hypothetical protein n=1 Tax=Mucilaginibacter sp. dw_454 TaxID=2720079 RepID=UPI001BD51FFC|nr:hypothetical protein [Mucilaginibacter sp. dw_454]